MFWWASKTRRHPPGPPTLKCEVVCHGRASSLASALRLFTGNSIRRHWRHKAAASGTHIFSVGVALHHENRAPLLTTETVRCDSNGLDSCPNFAMVAHSKLPKPCHRYPSKVAQTRPMLPIQGCPRFDMVTHPELPKLSHDGNVEKGLRITSVAQRFP